MSLGHFTVWYSIFKITQTIININVSKGRSQNFYVRLRGTMEIKVGPHQYTVLFLELVSWEEAGLISTPPLVRSLYFNVCTLGFLVGKRTVSLTWFAA